MNKLSPLKWALFIVGFMLFIVGCIPALFCLVGLYLMDKSSNLLNVITDYIDAESTPKVDEAKDIEKVKMVQTKMVGKHLSPLPSADFTAYDKKISPELQELLDKTIPPYTIKRTGPKMKESAMAYWEQHPDLEIDVKKFMFINQLTPEQKEMWRQRKETLGFYSSEKPSNDTNDHGDQVNLDYCDTKYSHKHVKPDGNSTYMIHELERVFLVQRNERKGDSFVIQVLNFDITINFVELNEGVPYSQHANFGLCMYSSRNIYFLMFPSDNTIFHELFHMYLYLTGQRTRYKFDDEEDMVEMFGCAVHTLLTPFGHVTDFIRMHMNYASGNATQYCIKSDDESPTVNSLNDVEMPVDDLTVDIK